MKIIILGSGTGSPSLKRRPPGIFLELNSRLCLMDSGPGILWQILKLNVTYKDLDCLFYTHLHLDHIGEFATILFASKIPPDVRLKSLTVYGPAGLASYYERIKILYRQTIEPSTYQLDILEISDSNFKIGEFELITKTLKHHGGGMGYRIRCPDNKVFVYSGDTDYCPEIVELAQNADILILECSAPNEYKMEGHLTPSFAGRIAEESGAKELILTHMYPICERFNILDMCRKEYRGKVALAEDFMMLKL